MTASLWILFLFLLFAISVDGALESSHQANCLFDKDSIECSVALFSMYNFAVIGTVTVPHELPTLCSRTVNYGSKIAVVRRGDCGFMEKAKNAAASGFTALIIVNNDNSCFPPGSDNPSYHSKIPVVLIGKNSWPSANACLSNDCLMTMNVDLRYDKAPIQTGVNSWVDNMHYVGFYLVTILVLAMACVATTQHRITSNICSMIILLCTIGLFVIMRAGTFRELLPHGHAHQVHGQGHSADHHNHQETDERIFMALVSRVTGNWSDYSLPASVISQLRLAEENYQDSLFIHPPVFVYLSALLHSPALLGCSFAVLAVLYQTVSLISVASISLSLMGASASAVNCTLWSIIIFSTCPIAAFCSQKFWIDNCLVMTSSCSVALHVWLCSQPRQSSFGRHWSCGRQLFSGLVFGMVAMNTKITAAALLPCLLLWTVLHRALLIERTGDCSAVHLGFDLMDTCQHLLCFTCGATVGHAPWVWLYHSRTGRWLPNAWPSVVMLARSPFLQAAVAKPWHSYCVTLISTSPACAAGLLFGLVTIVSAAWFVIGNIFRRSPVPLDDRLLLRLRIAILAVWPLTFAVSFSGLAAVGMGTQMRFILPAIPACALLAALGVTACDHGHQVGLVTAVMALLVSYAAVHALYYGVLYAPLYADLDHSMLDIIVSILHSPYHPPLDRDSYEETLRYMKHFGMMR